MSNICLFINFNKKQEISEIEELKEIEHVEIAKEENIPTSRYSTESRKETEEIVVEEQVVEEPIITEYFPTESHRVSSKYGNRSRGDFHTGIDLCGGYGDNIYAYKKGTVIKVQYSKVSYGNMILMEHEDGMKTRYAHLSSIKVKNGECVYGGQIIGYMGATGNATGNHLHFEVIIGGKPVNPYNYIF